MTIEKFYQPQAEISNKELIKLSKEQVSKLCKTGGKSMRMSVPPNVKDTDMLLCEVLRRLELFTTKFSDAIKMAEWFHINYEEISIKNVNLKVWDLSGQAKMRTTWKYYYEQVNGLVFVVDSLMDKSELLEVRDTIH